MSQLAAAPGRIVAFREALVAPALHTLGDLYSRSPSEAEVSAAVNLLATRAEESVDLARSICASTEDVDISAVDDLGGLTARSRELLHDLERSLRLLKPVTNDLREELHSVEGALLHPDDDALLRAVSAFDQIIAHFQAARENVEAIKAKLAERWRQAFLESLSNPHPESRVIAEEGFSDWVASLPEEDGDLCDPDAGQDIHWVEGEGWFAGKP